MKIAELGSTHGERAQESIFTNKIPFCEILRTMPRFVILIHDHPYPHRDFLLENGEGCRTWRLPADLPAGSSEFPASELPDHRLMYLDYEGPVSGNRGNVVLWDAGTFEWIIDEPSHCEARLVGCRWQGRICLKQIESEKWLGNWSPDPPS